MEFGQEEFLVLEAEGGGRGQVGEGVGELAEGAADSWRGVSFGEGGFFFLFWGGMEERAG